MLLNALWSGSCRVKEELPAALKTELRPLGFPMVFLDCCLPAPQRVSVHHEAQELEFGLSYGDAVAHELAVDVPKDALIIALYGHGGAAPQGLLAEVLYKVITQYYVKNALSIFLWAYRSLGLREQPDLISAPEGADAALEQVLGYPRGRAQMGFRAYLQMIDPDCVALRPDQTLRYRLPQGQGLIAWLSVLQVEFARQMTRHSLSLNCPQE